MSQAELRKVWLDAGRPGAARFYAAARRADLPIKLADARRFVEAQETRQVFAPSPRSRGRVTSTRQDDKWQADILDFKQMDASQNGGMRNVLMVVDVFTRFLWAVPMEDKAGETVADAFEAVLRTNGGGPAEVDTLGGTEFGATFDALLENTTSRTARKASTTRTPWRSSMPLSSD